MRADGPWQAPLQLALEETFAVIATVVGQRLIVMRTG